VLIGLLLGVIIMLPLITALVTLGVRVVSHDAALTWSELVPTSLQALIAGLLIAFIEETFFRGAMFTAVERETGLWLAAILTSLLYAALHFMRTGYAVPSDHLEWYSGVLVLGHLFEQYADPASIVDSFLALFAVGMLLALVRAKTGHIAWCIGLHAGWVITIKLTKDITDVDPSVQFSFLVGTYDGVVGYLALILIAVTAAGYYALAMRRSG
jgi:membrane protease YdiL (CAAX protease family)